MRQIMEGSHAVAQTIKLIKPKVVSAYPITPQTHIVEALADYKAKGDVDYEYVLAESEFAAASIVEGACLRGVRTYTATSSQGLLLMAEVLFNIAGMRLPMVMTVANRALSGPINIWNDQQDAVTVRDSGWLMLYAEDNQEAADMHVEAYKLAESLNLPVMVNMDGYVLTHTFEPVEIPDSKLIKKFLPEYKPKQGTYLDVKNPRTFGAFATPETYMNIREDLFNQVAEAKSAIKKTHQDFKKIFKRGNGDGVVDTYQIKDAEIVLVSFGSVLGTIKDVVDEQRKKGVKVGVLKVRCFRPFPALEIVNNLKKAKYIGVVEKCLSIGNEGILANEIKAAAYDAKLKGKISSFIVGLGGRDVTKNNILEIISAAKKGNKKINFVYGAQ
ncbi:MAG: transketolase C-terminal domain-containing protein [Patescibacteria group bacterium]